MSRYVIDLGVTTLYLLTERRYVMSVSPQGLKLLCSGTMEEVIYLTVDGSSYLYSLEKVHHKAFFKMMKHTPGKALNFIKTHSMWCEKEK